MFMPIKLLQLNIFQGKLLPAVLEYIKQSQFDILQLQEVSGGSFSKGGLWTGPRATLTESNPETIGIDCFQIMKEELGYEGIMNKTIVRRSDAKSYIGNATFFKPSVPLKAAKELFLKPYVETDEHIDAQDAPRAALMTTFLLNNKEVTFINCHLAWGPTPEDEPYKIDQAKILIDYIKSLKTSFVLTGDFNVTADSQIVKWMNEIGRNLNLENNITNTLNPDIHAAKVLFPKGLAVDYAFASKQILVSDFHVVDKPNLSDHFGLSLTLDPV